MARHHKKHHKHHHGGMHAAKAITAAHAMADNVIHRLGH